MRLCRPEEARALSRNARIAPLGAAALTLTGRGRERCELGDDRCDRHTRLELLERWVALKGGSWLEPNPANQRADAHLFEPPSRADEDSGFRCVKRLAAWPDADVWMSHLR